MMMVKVMLGLALIVAPFRYATAWKWEDIGSLWGRHFLAWSLPSILGLYRVVLFDSASSSCPSGGSPKQV